MNWRRSILLTATLLCTNFSVQGNPAELTSSIELILQQEGLSGAAWVTVSPGESIQTGTAGLRDRQADRAFGPDTRFHIGSVAKTVLAIGVLRLASSGQIDLDAPISSYLTDLDMDNPWLPAAPVTTRHLLDHTAGLQDARLWQVFSQRPAPTTPLAAAFPQGQQLLSIRTRPGDRFSYSNMGYGLLGMLIEQVTGERYEAYLDTNLLAPLGMRDSTFEFTSQSGPFEDPQLAWGHVDDGSRYAAAPIFLRPAGQFTTTANDLGTFAQFLLSDGSVNGEPFVNQSLISALGRPTDTEAARAGLLAGYGLGLARRDRHGVVGYCHSGSIVGFAALLCIFPNEQKAFAYSTNTDSETANHGRIAATLIDSLSLEAANSPPTTTLSETSRQWLGYYILSPNRFGQFLYLDRLFASGKLSAQGQALEFKSLSGTRRVLRPAGEQLFSAENRRTVSHVLTQGRKNEWLLSDGFSTYEKISAAYLFGLWANTAWGLLGLLWILIGGLWFTIRLRRAAFRHPLLPALLGTLSLLVPIPILMTQSFISLGDATVGSVALAAASLALPVGAVLTVVRLIRSSQRSLLSALHLLAAVGVIQWSVILAWFGFIPLRLWS